MATWAEVQNHMRTKYKLAADNPTWLSLDFQYKDGRLQRVFLGTFEALGKHWLQFRSRICRRDQLDPEVACRKTGGFAVGALGLFQDQDQSWYYEMVYATMLETLQEEEIEVPLHVICGTADGLEKEIVGADVM